MYQTNVPVQRRTNMFDSRYPTSIQNFFATFKQTCNSSGVHERAVMWCVKHSVTKSAATSSASRLYLKNRKSSDKPKG